MQVVPNCFNTQPPEGGWYIYAVHAQNIIVSTHSRLKAAGNPVYQPADPEDVSTHSRLKAAGCWAMLPKCSKSVFQHTAA